jgi:hypothetical protein
MLKALLPFPVYALITWKVFLLLLVLVLKAYSNCMNFYWAYSYSIQKEFIVMSEATSPLVNSKIYKKYAKVAEVNFQIQRFQGRGMFP